MTTLFRSGFAAILGKPNAGKSTLLNAIIGSKLAAVSALPQTTRERLLGIHSDERRQVIFVDLPGLIAPTDRLNEALRENIFRELPEVDCVIHLIDAGDADPFSEDVQAAVLRTRCPMVLALNKIDGKNARVDVKSWAGERIPPALRDRYKAVLGLSAAEKRGIAEVLDAVAALLPEGGHLYDPDDLTDRDLRYLAQELIREKLYLFLHEELPYASAVTVEDFKERERGKWYIAANIHVERDSQKGIVIGNGGATLKKISQAARIDIERLCGAAVYLELHVKVRENWRKKDHDLRDFGYKARSKKKK